MPDFVVNHQTCSLGLHPSWVCSAWFLTHPLWLLFDRQPAPQYRFKILHLFRMAASRQCFSVRAHLVYSGRRWTNPFSSQRSSSLPVADLKHLGLRSTVMWEIVQTTRVEPVRYQYKPNNEMSCAVIRGRARRSWPNWSLAASRSTRPIIPF